MLPDDASILSLRDANQRFYDAFGSLDMAQMDAVWEQSERALCVHPGWQPIVGWPDIRRSWQGIFNGAALMHFNIHYVNIALGRELRFRHLHRKHHQRGRRAGPGIRRPGHEYFCAIRR